RVVDVRDAVPARRCSDLRRGCRRPSEPPNRRQMVLFPNDVGETSPWVAAKSRIVAIGGAEMASHRHGWRNDRAPSPEYSCKRCLRRLGKADRESTRLKSSHVKNS